MTFANEMVKAVEYQLCDRDLMIQDFKDYIVYVRGLQESGEHYDQIVINGVPSEIYETRAIYCSRGCSATHYLHGQCLLYEEGNRKGYDIIEKLSMREQMVKPHCKGAYRAKDLQRPPFRDYDWKKGFQRWDWL